MKASPFKITRFSFPSLTALALLVLVCFAGLAPGVIAGGKKGSEAAIPPKVGDAAPGFALPYATQEQIYFKPEERLSLVLSPFCFSR